MYTTVFHVTLLCLFILIFKICYVLLSSAVLSDLSQLKIRLDMEITVYSVLPRGIDL